MLNYVFGKLSKDIAIDLGTGNTLVYTVDKGIIINEPSVVAFNTRTDQILAVGNEAKEMIGKTPAHIQTVRPLVHGIIADYEVTEKMIKYFMDKVHEGGFTFAPRPRIVVSAPLEITEVEQKAIEDAARAAGSRETYIIEGPMAAAIGARMPIEDPIGNLILDIGAGKTEIAVISLGGVVEWRSVNTGGDEMNKNIVQYARDVFNLLLGEGHAEDIKIHIGSALPLPERIEYPMRGRDLLTGLPKEVAISDEQVREALARSVRSIIEAVKTTLEATPPELVADIHERGMLLTGGGSLLRGIDKIIAEHTKIPVRIADDPLTCVVRGVGLLLDNMKLLKEVALPPATESVRK